MYKPKFDPSTGYYISNHRGETIFAGLPEEIAHVVCTILNHDSKMKKKFTTICINENCYYYEHATGKMIVMPYKGEDNLEEIANEILFNEIFGDDDGDYFEAELELGEEAEIFDKAINNKIAEKEIDNLYLSLDNLLLELHKATQENKPRKKKSILNKLDEVRRRLMELEYFPYKETI